MTEIMNYARQRGWMPDWAWYQLNGKSAQENWMEQRERFFDPDTTNDEPTQIVFASEVKIKK